MQGQNERLALDCVVEIVHKPLKEKGEDAFAYSFERGDVQTHAVFDGCGGAGSWQYAEFKDATGAWIAAQSIAKAYLDWFYALSPAAVQHPAQIEASFHDMAQGVLADLKRRCAPMRVSGSLVKSFPCTASAALMTPAGPYVSLTALQIGDSRVYFLTPQTGLVQFTVDDSVGDPDPLESLRDSAPLSDMLNADQPFHVKCRQVRLSTPCAILTATDGVFGYFRSPMDFEAMLLDAMARSDTFAQFESLCKEAIVGVTGDDSCCIMSFYGWGSFAAFKKAMTPRYEAVLPLIRALDEAAERGETDAALDEIWKGYRKQTLFDEMQG